MIDEILRITRVLTQFMRFDCKARTGEIRDDPSTPRTRHELAAGFKMQQVRNIQGSKGELVERLNGPGLHWPTSYVALDLLTA